MLLLFAVYAGLYASRNIPVAAILLVLVIGPIIPSFGLGEFSGRMTRLEWALKGHIWPMVFAIAGLAVALNNGHVGSEQAMNARFDPQRMQLIFTTYNCGTGYNRYSNDVVGQLYWETVTNCCVTDGVGGGGPQGNAGGAWKISGLLGGVGVDANVGFVVNEVTSRRTAGNQNMVVLHLDPDDFPDHEISNRLQSDSTDQQRVANGIGKEWTYESGIQQQHRRHDDRGHAHQQGHGQAALSGVNADLPLDLEAFANDVREIVENFCEIAAGFAL